MTNYKSTLNLPDTPFSMRAQLPQREPEALKRWESDEVYAQMIARRKAEGAPMFLLHDGPPYANGTIHHGHILNKVLKDFVVKYKSLSGYVCPFVPGWDCHGLPIEHQVDKNLGKKKREMTKVQIRQACREYAEEFVAIQRDEFKRALILADWEHPYRTMDYSYEATTVRELGRFFERGLVYQGLKPVHWDWAAQTALAEAEVDYKAFTTEQVYVKFPFEQLPEALRAHVPEDHRVFVVIWTTTPWTLPANVAVALNPELDYQLVRRGEEVYVFAQGLVEQTLKACGIPEGETERLVTFKGSDLVGELGVALGLKARHPFIDRDSYLLPADYVTLEQGTGCVHTAPGHGQEDFALCQGYELPVINPVNRFGKFDEMPGTEGVVGVQVHKANPAIVARLDEAGALLNGVGDQITIARYPHGWRSKAPVIFRATTQWFVAMEPESDEATSEATYRLRERALETIDHDITWLPAWGHDRIHGMVQSRPDWCISRQRSWGVPITAMHCDGCAHVVATGELAEHVAALVEQRGVDVWFELKPEELLPKGFVCPGCGGTSFYKEEDILDVWFDSGTSWSAVLETQLGLGDQADLYLEGSDQHRGWFQSSLLCGLVSRDHSPYKTCLTHGFVVDKEGRKYSKSSKNFEPPQRMIDDYGAEILRFWVAAVDYRGDITLSKEVLKRVADAYRKVRNTLRFLLGNLNGFEPDRDAVEVSSLLPLDRWIVQRAAGAVERIREAYETYQFHTIYHTAVQFMTTDLSSFYLDVSKDRMYCELPDGPARRSGQTATWMVLDALVRALSPVLSFTSQEVWEQMTRRAGDPDYVFWADFPEELSHHTGLVDERRWEALLEVRDAVQKALEGKRGNKKDKRPGQIGSSQEADVVIHAPTQTFELLEGFGAAALTELFIVAHVQIERGEALTIEIRPSAHQKCPRCWNHWVEPERPPQTPCARCTAVLSHLDIAPPSR